MTSRRKSLPRKRIKSSSEAWDRVERMARFSFFRGGLLGSRAPKEDQYPVIPEPDEELEDSELSEGERRSAVARERMRREGML